MTSKGTKLLAEIQKVAAVVNAEIMNGIGARDVMHAEEVLYKMKQQLIAMDAVAGHHYRHDSKQESSDPHATHVQLICAPSRSHHTTPPASALAAPRSAPPAADDS